MRFHANLGPAMTSACERHLVQQRKATFYYGYASLLLTSVIVCAAPHELFTGELSSQNDRGRWQRAANEKQNKTENKHKNRRWYMSRT